MALHPQNHAATIIMDTPWVTPSKAVLGNLNIVHCPRLAWSQTQYCTTYWKSSIMIGMVLAYLFIPLFIYILIYFFILFYCVLMYIT